MLRCEERKSSMCFRSLGTWHLEACELISLLSSQRECLFSFLYSWAHAITATVCFLQQLLFVFFYKCGKWCLEIDELLKVTQQGSGLTEWNLCFPGFNIFHLFILWCWRNVCLPTHINWENGHVFSSQFERGFLPMAELYGVSLF